MPTKLRMMLIALALSTITAHALADSPDAHAPTQPEHRVDVVIPSVGLGWFVAPAADYDRVILTGAVDVRYAHRSGHGVMARAAFGSTFWGGGTGGDLDYLYRTTLAGDRHLSLGLDLMAGLTVAELEHDEDTLPVGWHVGGNTSLSLDLRARNFVVSLGGQYRAIFPTEAAPNGGATGPEHALTATLGLGFTFY